MMVLALRLFVERMLARSVKQVTLEIARCYIHIATAYLHVASYDCPDAGAGTETRRVCWVWAQPKG